MKWVAAILVLSGCISSNYSRFPDPKTAYECAAYLMSVEAPGPIPTLVWRNELWFVGSTLVRGTYNRRTNEIQAHREWVEAPTTVVHEAAHAVRYHIGGRPDEDEAKEIASRLEECPAFS